MIQTATGPARTDAAWAATIAALLGYEGLHVTVPGIIAIYPMLPAWDGKLHGRNCRTFDNCALVWHGSVLQGVPGTPAVTFLPR